MRHARVVAALAFALTPTSLAWEGCHWGGPSEELAVMGFYVDIDPCQPDCVASVWIYQESNGIHGLQRNDPVVVATCGGKLEGDTIVAGAFA